MSVTVSLIGASTRAAACSAWRAGWRPRACDLFGDVDLSRLADCERLRGPYPHGLAGFIHDGPDVPWMYTGGLENHPALIDEMARSRPLWGNTGGTLRAVRDPFTLGEALRSAGFDFPESSRLPRRSGPSYLVKPLRGSGGGRIRLSPERSLSSPAPRGYFYQRFRSGISCSAIYVGAARSARALGVTRQLVGVPWLHAPPFSWCGSVGPLALKDSQRALLERLGPYLARRFGLAGLFGVDFVISDGEIVIIEVNPRYPASLEVLELAVREAALPLHRAAFESTAPRTWPDLEETAACERVIGKAVLFAPRRCVVTEDLLSLAATAPFSVPVAADLPPPGTEIEPGRPVLTVYARGSTHGECLLELENAAGGFERRLVAAL